MGARLDPLTIQERSERMSRVRSKDTRPELAVRKLVHKLGFRFRLHRKDIPGRPDLVFPSRRKAIFVHGCFWHRHQGCALARLPKTRPEFWVPKLEGNRLRDRKKQRELRRAGWDFITIWECEVKDQAAVVRVVNKFLRVTC